MEQNHKKKNPFAVQTPDTLTSDDMVDLFVQEFTCFSKVEESGHAIIFGPRGTGKSSILRFMEPDCQMVAKGVELEECNYLGVSIPLKSTVNLPEFDRLEKIGHGHRIMNEHALVCEVLGRFLYCLDKKIPNPKKEEIYTKLIPSLDHIKDAFILLPDVYKDKINNITSYSDLMSFLKDIHYELRKANKDYIDSVQLSSDVLSYEGVIVDYNDFLKPLLEAFLDFVWMPRGPIYLLFDDADHFGKTQTQILNSWIAQRSTNTICIKVAVIGGNGKYKSFETLSGMRIETPHDYSAYHVNAVHTARGSTYNKQIKAIIEKRFNHYNISSTPEDFFPENKKQKEGIDKIGRKIEEGVTKGYRPSDDVYRYARPEYMKSLAGSSKQLSSYSYSGFEQLVNISDGLPRDFLAMASEMYADSYREGDNMQITSLAPSVQNEVVRRYSDDFLLNEFDVRRSNKESGIKLTARDKLLNMLNAMGGMFGQILLSDAAERRVFSIAFSNGPDHEVQEIINLGVEYRYFKTSTIGNKEGTGRVPLLVLSRVLAPHFKLDPNGFAGYKSVQNSVVKASLGDPKKLLNAIKKKLQENPSSELNEVVGKEGDLFDDK